MPRKRNLLGIEYDVCFWTKNQAKRRCMPNRMTLGQATKAAQAKAKSGFTSSIEHRIAGVLKVFPATVKAIKRKR